MFGVRFSSNKIHNDQIEKIHTEQTWHKKPTFPPPTKNSSLSQNFWRRRVSTNAPVSQGTITRSFFRQESDHVEGCRHKEPVHFSRLSSTNDYQIPI
jgi:hypothetical protein